MKTYVSLHKKANRGFTLVEVMISMGLLFFISTMMLAITGTGRISWPQVSAQLFLKSQAQGIISTLVPELSQARSGSGGVFLPTASEIAFCIPLVNADGTLRLDVGGNVQWGDGSTLGNYIDYIFRNDISGNPGIDRRILQGSPAGTQLSSQRVARHVASFLVTPTTGGTYNFAIRFSVANFFGTTFPQAVNFPPITGTPLIFSVSPQN